MAGIIDWISEKIKGPDIEVSEEYTIDTTWVDDGVYVSPTPITAGENVSIKYNGLLAKSGAEQLTLRMGYGHAEWNGINDILMSKIEDQTFEAKIKIPIEECSRLQFCFVDNAGNWDNNTGKNWSYEIHCGEQVEF